MLRWIAVLLLALVACSFVARTAHATDPTFTFTAPGQGGLCTATLTGMGSENPDGGEVIMVIDVQIDGTWHEVTRSTYDDVHESVSIAFEIVRACANYRCRMYWQYCDQSGGGQATSAAQQIC